VRSLLDEQGPLDLLVLASKMKGKGLLRGQDDLDGPVRLLILIILDHLIDLVLVLDEGPHQCMEENPLLLLTTLVKHHIATLNNKPKRSQLIHISFQEAVTLSMSLLRVAHLRKETIIIKGHELALTTTTILHFV
jgi:hypothetical protein